MVVEVLLLLLVVGVGDSCWPLRMVGMVVVISLEF